MKVALVTGASTGIGRACADSLARRGWKVWGVSRSIEQLAPRPGFTCANLDVTKEADVAALLERLVREEGRLDAVVNSAGYVLAGAAEETSTDEVRRQFETNYFAVASLCRLVAPRFRAQGHGHLVNISSLAAQVPMAFQAHYSASKAALTSFSCALRAELEPFGVKVVAVEPGDFATPVTAARRLPVPPAHSAYPALGRTLAVIERDERGAAGPEAVGELVARILEARDPAATYRVGALVQRLAVPLRALLPARLFDWVVAKLYRL